MHWKGVHLAIRAFAEYLQRAGDARLTIHMDGPDRPRLEALTRRLGITRAVVFDVTSTAADVQRMYDEHDVLLFPSLHDSGSFVTLEAMSRAMPVICLDLGGPAHSVTDAVGIRVEAKSPAQAVRDMAEALSRLGDDGELRTRMGEAGRRRLAESFSWESKGEFLRCLYAAAAAEGQVDFEQVRKTVAHVAQRQSV
jgi:glycosyltransferase involved in cell wall biosynthesis